MRRTGERPALGITLIEGLVVFGAFVLVAALVLPILLNARRGERQASCISNLQQIGLALEQYAQDNDQTLFNPFYFGYCDKMGPNGYLSNSTLEPYLKNRAPHSANSVWVCPEITRFSTVRTTSRTGWGAFYCTYTMNVFLNPPLPPEKGGRSALPEPDVCYSGAADQARSIGWSGGGAREELMSLAAPHGTERVGGRRRRVPSMQGVRLSQVVSPQNTDMVFEGVVEDLYRGTIDKGYVGRAPRQGDYTLEQGFWPSQQQAEQFLGSRLGFTLQPAARPRHGEVNNYLFCDGHVKAMRPKTFPYDIQHDPDNIWFTRIGRHGEPIPNPGGPGC